MASTQTQTKEHQSYTAYRTPTHAEIEQRARELWQEAGQPEGRDVEFWLNAEQSLQFPANVKEETQPAVPPQTPSPQPEDAAPATRASAAPDRASAAQRARPNQRPRSNRQK
jgi:hypothetical protein